jgi:O-antigen/teichoic acid export membrane protein
VIVRIADAPALARWPGHEGTVGLLITLAIAVQVAQIATAAIAWRRVFGSRGDVQVPRRGALVTLLRRALPFAATGLVANAQTRIAPLMLGYWSTASELGLFSAAARFGSVARMAPQALFAGALPVLSHEHDRDPAAARRAFHTFDRMLIAGSTLAAIACALGAAPVLRLVYGPSFTGAAPALLWITIGLIPLLSNSGRKVFLFASGREAEVVRWSAVALAIQLVLGAILIPVFGSVGAAIGIAAGEAIVWWPLRRTKPSADAAAAEAPRLASAI